MADDLARLFWRSGSKKGGYAALMKPLEALAHKLEVAEEKTSLGGFAAMPGPPKPIGLRFNFIEVCGGAAKVSAEVSKRGWVVGPCIDLDRRSEHYNLASIEVLSWLIHMVESDQLDAYFVQPPCTTFSPAAHPAVRSYDAPRVSFQLMVKPTSAPHWHCEP